MQPIAPIKTVNMTCLPPTQLAGNKTIQTSTNTINFSVGGNDNGRMGYDANGNIKSMSQMGLKLNNSSLIDQLSYTYTANTNKLQQV
jgi:hypothetical protein